MESVSASWEPHIRSGFTPVTYVDVSFPGEGIVFADLPVETGSITMAWGESDRSNGTLVVTDPELFPALNEGSPIAPYGAELIIKTGVRYSDHDEELVQMGVFPIWSIRGSEKGGHISSLTYHDRSKLVDGMHSIAGKDYSGWLVQAAITDVLTQAAAFYPGTGVEWSVNFHPSLANFLLPGGTMFNEGRWAFASKLAKRMGAILHFDRQGDVQVRPVPGIAHDELLSSGIYVVNTGHHPLPGYTSQVGAVLIDAERQIDRSDIYNGVVVKGSTAQGAGSQPFYLATDDDPNSRTYWDGPFGKNALPLDMNELTTTGQCEIAAKAELRKLTGAQKGIQLIQVGNPALDPWDVLRVDYSSGQQELHMLTSYTYDFKTALMTGPTKSVNYVED